MHNAAVNVYGQSIPIQRVCICKYTYWLKFICNPKMNMLGTITVIHRHVQRGKKFESLCAHMPSWGRTSYTLPSCSGFHDRNKGSFMIYLVLYIYIYIFFFYIFVLVCCFKWSPRIVLQVLSSVHKHSKVALCPREKIQVLDKLSQAWVIGLLAEVQY